MSSNWHLVILATKIVNQRTLRGEGNCAAGWLRHRWVCRAATVGPPKSIRLANGWPLIELTGDPFKLIKPYNLCSLV